MHARKQPATTVTQGCVASASSRLDPASEGANDFIKAAIAINFYLAAKRLVKTVESLHQEKSSLIS